MNHILKNTIAAILATGIGSQACAETTMSPTLDKNMEQCYGVAKAGMNDCAYASKACSGSATVDNDKQAWISVPKGTCKKIVGGSTQSG